MLLEGSEQLPVNNITCHIHSHIVTLEEDIRTMLLRAYSFLNTTIISSKPTSAFQVLYLLMQHLEENV